MDIVKLSEILLTSIQPYIQELNLQGFSDINIVDIPEADFNARVINGQIEFNRYYFTEKAKLALEDDLNAQSDLLNTLHHELCHIDIDNKMPFLCRPLRDNEVFPLGITFRFIKEFLACSHSFKTMSLENLKILITHGIDQINDLSKNQDIKNYCDIVCTLAYLLGNCIYAPCAFFVSLCNSIDNKVVNALSRRLLNLMSEFECQILFATEDDVSPIYDTILTSWKDFNKVGG